MKSRAKWILRSAILLAAVGLCVLGLYLVRIRLYKDKIASIRFQQLDLTEIPNGSYKGEYDADIVGAKVIVTVQDGKITDIQLTEHKNERGAPAEAVLPKIIREQRVEVDAITGATNSSKAIEKAVENALLSQQK